MHSDKKKPTTTPKPTGPAYGRPADAFMAEQAALVGARREHLHRALTLAPQHVAHLAHADAPTPERLAERDVAQAQTHQVDLPETAPATTEPQAPAQPPKDYVPKRVPLEVEEA